MEWAADHFVPLMFGGLLVALLTGFPVAFALAATGLAFGLLGIGLGLFPVSMFQALSLRVFGIMQNDILLAVPFFTLMGIVLERSGIAEDLLETAGQVFGPLRGGLALSVIAVGALLAATTGVVSAAIMSMGLISLPVMLRFGYRRSIATGVVMASGSLAQALPPSVVLIVLADQLGRSVGDMYTGAMIPGLMLVGLYALFIIALAFVRPAWVPALPVEARIYREAGGASGHRSLLFLGAFAVAAGLAWSLVHDAILGGGPTPGGNASRGETLVLSVTVGAATALLVALADRALSLRWLSRLSVRVTLMLIPPLVLIFLVLGTIFVGVATPTEAGAMGAVGSLVLAIARRRLDWTLLTQAVDYTTQLTCFVVFILIGATVFSFTFNAADGHIWVEHLFDRLPGGQIGFLVAVNMLVFALGFFIDFFEIAFIVIPILAPVADKMGIDLIWFGVVIAINLQTSYLTPPFGFALFFLRSVAPRADYVDRITNQLIRRVTTAEIYKGSVAFVVLQLLMVGLLIARPELVTGQLDTGPKVDPASVEIEAERGGYGTSEDEDPMKRFAR